MSSALLHVDLYDFVLHFTLEEKGFRNNIHLSIDVHEMCVTGKKYTLNWYIVSGNCRARSLVYNF